MAIPALLFGVAIVARLLMAMLFPDPAYPDAFYYVNVARELASGQGFQVDYIWNFVEVGTPFSNGGMITAPQIRRRSGTRSSRAHAASSTSSTTSADPVSVTTSCAIAAARRSGRR